MLREKPIEIASIVGQPGPGSGPGSAPVDSTGMSPAGQSLADTATAALGAPQTMPAATNELTPVAASGAPPEPSQPVFYSPEQIMRQVQDGTMTREDAAHHMQAYRLANRRPTYTAPTEDRWQPARRDLSPVQSEEQLGQQQMQAQASADLTEAQAREQAAITDQRTSELERQNAEEAERIRVAQAREAEIQDQLAAMQEHEQQQQQKWERGESDNPQSLFGNMGKFGRFIAKVAMFSNPELLLGAAKLEADQQAEQARARSNTYANFLESTNSERAARAMLEKRLLGLAQSKLSVYGERAKSAQMRGAAEQAQQAAAERILQLEVERDQAMQGKVVEQFIPGRAGGTSGGPDLVGALAAAGQASGGQAADPEARARQVTNPETGAIEYVANVAEQPKVNEARRLVFELEGRRNKLRQLYLDKSAAMPGSRARAALEARYKTESAAMQDVMRSESFANTGVMSEGEAKRLKERDFSRYAGLNPLTRDSTVLADFDSLGELLASKRRALEQKVYKDPGATTLLNAPTPNAASAVRR